MEDVAASGVQATATADPDEVLKALADPNRRQILRLVRHTALPAAQIAQQFAVTRQAVSLHLGVLKRAGLLSEDRGGTRRRYRFRPEALDPVRTAGASSGRTRLHPPDSTMVGVSLVPTQAGTMVSLTHRGLPEPDRISPGRLARLPRGAGAVLSSNCT